MTIEEIYSNYNLYDGEIVSIKVAYDIDFSTIGSILLKVRRILPKNKFEIVVVELRITNLVEVYINEDFTSMNYSDITLIVLDNGLYYLSLDPYDNSNKPNAEDNFVFKGRSLDLIVVE